MSGNQLGSVFCRGGIKQGDRRLMELWACEEVWQRI